MKNRAARSRTKPRNMAQDRLRKPGQFGPRVDVPADAGPQEQLLGFIGRDPYWRP